LAYLYVNEKIKIPMQEINFRFARSSGPGGQKVNKANTKVHLVWSLDLSKSMDLILKDYLSMRLAKHLNDRGEIHIYSDQYRSQDRNKKDCLDKLKQLLSQASKTQKKRKKTKPKAAQKEKRLKEKKRRGEIKSLRKKVEH